MPDDPEMVASMLGYLKNRNLPVADYPPGVLPWLDRDGGPLGLPFVHFANRLLPNDGPGGARARSADSRYGVSALAGGVVAAQDRLNLIHWDILTSSGFTGSQMLWGTGVTPPRNQETGKVEPYQIVPGAIITDGSKDARFGTFPPGQITAHERALQVTKEAVAQIAELPLVFIMTEAPSGEALMRGEAGLAEKVDKLGEATGPTWASLQHKGTRLANTFANAELDEQARIATVFTAAQRINLVGVADAVAKLAAVFGVREAARQAGLQPSDIERIVDELAEDDAAFDRAAGGAAATLAAELGRVGG